MSSLLLKPDRRFVEEVTATGGGDLKKCYQCATCSVVCDLSNGSKPFPRKEMIWAQWGLKDRLMADPDIWLCHQCNDCSTRCPRGARPGDVLSALRLQAVRHYAFPRILGKWMNDVKYLPIVVLITAALIGTALLVRDPLNEIFNFHEHPGFYADFFPHWLLIGFFDIFTGLAALVLLMGLVPYWKAMRSADKAEGRPEAVTGWASVFVSVLGSIFFHNKFGKCTESGSRKTAHFWSFYGFLALFIVTAWAVTDIYVMPRLGVASMYPFNLMHPMKILGNIGALMLIAGCLKAIYDRTSRADDAGTGSQFDWIFLCLLLGVGVSGVLTEMFRFVAEPAGTAQWLATFAYSVYFVHLVLVFVLLVFLPYSKFAHIMWRSVALTYAARYGRGEAELLAPPPPTGELQSGKQAAAVAATAN